MDEAGLESHVAVDKGLKRKRIMEDKACEVCGDRSTGKHYGVYACDGCSGFYKRTCRRTEPWHCKAEGRCLVDKSSRNDCKACRLKKCLEIGMNLEGVYRRSKLRSEDEPSFARDSPHDITSRDLLSDTSPQTEPQGFSLEVPQIRLGGTNPVSVKSEDEETRTEAQTIRVSSPQYYTVNTEAVSPRVSPGTSTRDQSCRVVCQSPLTTPQMTLSGPHGAGSARGRVSVQTATLPPNASLTSPTFLPPVGFSSPQQNGYHSPSRNSPSASGDTMINGNRNVTSALQPIRSVSGRARASQLSMSELRQAIDTITFHASEPLHEAATRLLSISLRFSRRLPSFRRLPFRDQVILLEEGWKEMLLLDALIWMFPLTSGSAFEDDSGPMKSQELKVVKESLVPLRTLKLDSSEYACLKAVILFRTNTHGLKAADQIEQLQDEAQLLLAEYIWSRLPGHPARFGKILLSVAVLRSLAEKPFEHLFFSSVPGKDMFESILSQVLSTN